MGVNTIDAALCAKMFLAGAKNLEANKEWINELNVFPVPDGDTGTNMTLTIMSAVKEVAALSPLTMEKLARAISSGSLRGARGNSGVILSQLFRGFGKVIRDEHVLTTQVLSLAFQKAVETAYKAVMKPKEGTILTVARGVSDWGTGLLEENPEIEMESFLTGVVAHAREVLEHTPDLLPVLKEAGVVDSGGQGLVQILQGALDAYLGKEVEYEVGSSAETVSGAAEAKEEEIRFGYCTEFIIVLEKEFGDEQELEWKAFLESIGDSIVVVADDGLVKVHVHTNDPGAAISRALTYGSLTKIKIDNMREEHQEKLIREADREASLKRDEELKAKAQPKKKVGFISVCSGSGMSRIFRDLGADCLIEGGQTMNPSTEDMLNAISQVNAESVFIFPNNPNIILAATQAKNLTTDRSVFVVPTTTMPQGITALINFVPERTAEENAAEMEKEIHAVHTGQLTYAVRDTHIEDLDIHEGDIMGVGDHGILAVGSDVHETAVEMVGRLMDEGSELISIFYGEDTSKEDAQLLVDDLAGRYPDCDIEVNEGGQPIYYYIISVE